MNALSTTSSWHQFLLSHAADDLLMVAEGRRLYYANTPIHLHWLDRVSLLLIRQAYLQRQSLALCYPVPVCNLPMLAASQLLIHDFVQNYPGNLSVLLISSRTEVRDHYLNLCVGREQLACIWPLARIRADGGPAVISSGVEASRQRPRLYHLSRPHLLERPWPKGIGLVIVDHNDSTFDEQTRRIDELAARRGIASVIHLCTDPFAPFLEELATAGTPVWVWDHFGLASDFGTQIIAGAEVPNHPFGVSVHQFQNIAAGIHHHLLVCRHPVLETTATRLWDDLAVVQRTFSGRSGLGIHRAIRAAYGTFYTMLQLPVPLAVYEEEAHSLWGIRPIRRRLADLEAFTPLLRDEASDLADVFWPSLLLDLKEMYTALLAGNPKYTTLVQQIRHHLSQNKRLTIVCPNQAIRRMLQLCLRAREGLRLSELGDQNTSSAIRLVTYRELNGLVSTDTLLFCGHLSYGRRHYGLTAAAPEIRYLAYGDEADRIERQISAIHQTLTQKARASARGPVWKILSASAPRNGLPEAAEESTHPAITFVRTDGTQVSRQSVRAATATDLSLWSPFSTVEYDVFGGQDTLTSESEEALRPSEFASSVRQSVLVPAVRIEFSDGFCYAEPESRMTVFLASSEQTEERRVDSLRPDDVVLFVDGDQRRHLYEVIMERIERHPTMGTTYILVRYWQQAVREGFLRSGMTYDGFLQELRSLGSHMQSTPGIRLWVTGEVLGPSDPADIGRVGMIFDDEALNQEWRAIDRALRKIRGLHVSLARKLNRAIVQVGIKSRHPDASEECIDQGLNLYLDDFRDSVRIHRIAAVNRTSSLVPYVFTGRFFEKGTEVPW